MTKFKTNQIVYVVDIAGTIRHATYHGKREKDGKVIVSMPNMPKYSADPDRVYDDIHEAIENELARQEVARSMALASVDGCNEAIKRLNRKKRELEL